MLIWLVQTAWIARYCSNGAAETIDEFYPGMEIPAEAGYSLSLRFNLDNISDPQGMLVKLSELKKNILGAPLRKVCSGIADTAVWLVCLFVA